MRSVKAFVKLPALRRQTPMEPIPAEAGDAEVECSQGTGAKGWEGVSALRNPGLHPELL